VVICFRPYDEEIIESTMCFPVKTYVQKDTRGETFYDLAMKNTAHVTGG
jgi:hypothetical protein